ncbi:DUF4129 domain-containing protein [Halosimplex salinum]|uniref:DUF4129 domain-containing protein n=1 Tax=Halosimplex salinum TaxID=1710538 RepID=UPI001F3796FD|nr:DUF4129 domain-containing protein [Halosimplex salinum]
MDDYVSQEALRFVVIGLVAMAAIAVGAATITATVDTGAPTGGEAPQDPSQNPRENQGGGGGDDGSGGGSINRSSESQSEEAIEFTTCIKPLTTWYGGIAYFGVFAFMVYLVKRRYSFGAAFLGLYAIAPPALLGYFLGTDCATVGGPGLGDQAVNVGTNNTSGPPVAGLDIPPAVILGVFGVVLVATAAVLLRASSDQQITTMEEEEPEAAEGADVMDLAEAAGRAADRLEEHNVDVDNEVYRAWWEMTSMLDVPNPDSATPGEFADAAIEVGLGTDDVTELTRLFEEVRYGKRDAESREQLAIDVFRNIEEEYGGTTAGGPSAVGDDTEGDDGY